MDLDYEKLLKRARKGLEEVMTDTERFQPPKPEIMHEGKKTILKNFGKILDSLRREEQHFSTYLLREIGTAGTIEGRRLILQGKVPTDKIISRISLYISSFVICDECERPDTQFGRNGRTLTLNCEACGAHRPVKSIN